MESDRINPNGCRSICRAVHLRSERCFFSGVDEFTPPHCTVRVEHKQVIGEHPLTRIRISIL